ncbi:serine/threonine-protein kinase Sgk3 isoform X2 [Pseudophryne corroboree]|uniref:serine/threonine-protein kinase Sgk3 isoform X2 n=1 Tax=Pseudophryne corroboree TaxID=495146 RepID=UPI0030819F96
MDQNVSCPSVDIPSYDEHREKKKRFTVYKVLVTVGRNEWFVFRRYAEFDKLYNTLKKQFPAINFKIPAKRIFGDNFDPEFIQQRRAGLNEFIQNLLQHSELCSHPDVQTFLKLDCARHQTVPSEDEDERSDQKNGSPSQNVNLGPSANPHAKPSDFEYLRLIGKGSFGKVVLTRGKSDGRYYAVKVLQKKVILNKKEQKHIMAERNVLLKNVKHPFLVHLHYSFQTSDKLFFVLDFINGGELFFHLQRERYFAEPRALFYAAEIASALGYLHSMQIIYRDLKPENILLDSEGHIVLTDFGLCKEGISNSDKTLTFCGTPEPPFYNRDTAIMYENILHNPLIVRTDISLTASSILEELLEKYPKHRLGSKNDFEDIKSHPFFSCINWTDLVEKKIPTPYDPHVDGPDDISNFDTEFTDAMVPDSVCISSDYSIVNASVEEADDAFVGFSYAPPSDDFPF